jgi:hypothetical protein
MPDILYEVVVTKVIRVATMAADPAAATAAAEAYSKGVKQAKPTVWTLITVTSDAPKPLVTLG